MGREANLPVASTESGLRFGPFRIVRSRRLLLEGTRPVRLGSRAFDILLALVDRAGDVVDKRDLIKSVWPNTVVEDTNLRVHITALRRALGEGKTEGGYILNVPGRGYSFVGTVTYEDGSAPRVELLSNETRCNSLPVPLTRMIGRDKALATLIQLVPQRRLVTIVGPGGVGKSTLALELTARLTNSYADGAHFIHLAAVAEASQVAVAIGTEIGLTLPTHDRLSSLLAFLNTKRMLLVLDNCEHVVAAVARLTESLLRGTGRLSILATTREPLGAEGEWQFRLPPLPVPPVEDTTTAEQAWTYAAVKLFVERAATIGYPFDLTDANASLVSEICRRLDGIPLAIELAAARLDRLGIQDLAARLNGRFLLWTCGRRTAAPRHQTLRAALEWSHEFLTDSERIVLRRLAVFKGAFTVDSAVAIAGHAPLDEQRAFDAVMSLTEKSLVATEVSEQTARHRLLHTTRAYAHEKLCESADPLDIPRWHAEHHLDLLRAAEIEWEAMSRSAWVRKYGPSIDDVRAALDWACSAKGDAYLGAALTIAAVPFGFQLALLDEFKDRVETALRLLAALEGEDTTDLVSRLNEAWKTLTLDARRLNPAATPATLPASATTSAHGGAADRLQSLVTETTLEIEAGRYQCAVEKAQHTIRVARDSAQPLAVLLAERVMAQAMHFGGHHATARMLAEKVLRHPARALPLAHQPMAVDRRVSMRIVLSRALWIEGSSERAQVVADESLEYASEDSPFSLCQALALAACPIAYWQGNHSRARNLTAQLLEQASRYRLGYWRAYGEWYQRVGSHAQRPVTRTCPKLTEPPSSFPLAGLLLDTLITIDPDLVVGYNQAPARDASGWCAPEMLRVRGERLLKTGGTDARATVEALFLTAIETARAQRAFAWQLRAVTSLAALWNRCGRLEEARLVLSAAPAPLSKGNDIYDMLKANELKDQLC